MAGPLSGVRIIELAGIGPGPFCAMVLADNGAEVIRINRPGEILEPGFPLTRSRKVLELNLKDPKDVGTLRALVCKADALIEGFRPGTLERLGIGPNLLLEDNPRLVVGRMTGWGQDGPYAPFAGHDINYIAISGALHAIGPASRPTPPPALVGDFGGGGMVLAFAVTAAILHARSTGVGQVIDCAMSEGSGLLMSAIYGLHAQGDWLDERAANLIDGGAHFYGAYQTADGKFISIGSIEPQFYALLIEKLGLTGDADFVRQLDRGLWPELRTRLEKIFLTKTRAAWCEVMEESDICFAPVLSMSEVADHPHNRARQAFVELDGIRQPAPTPRYSRTPLDAPRLPTIVSPRELDLT